MAIGVLFTTKLRLIFETAAFFYKYYKRKTLISEAEGRPGGSGGLGPQYIEDIRRKKSDAMRRSFCASDGTRTRAASLPVRNGKIAVCCTLRRELALTAAAGQRTTSGLKDFGER